jgi:hypothetical protein
MQNPERQQRNPNHYFSDRLSAEETALLREPVTMQTLEKVVGTLSGMQRMGFGRDSEYGQCKKYGKILLDFDRLYDEKSQTNQRVVIKCTVIDNPNVPFVLFGKHDDINASKNP